MALFCLKAGKIAKNGHVKPTFLSARLLQSWNAEIPSTITLEYGVFEKSLFRKYAPNLGIIPFIAREISRYGHLRILELREISFHSRVT